MVNNSEKPQNGADILFESIKNARVGVEAEFAKGGNPWLSCFGSRIFQVETYLSIGSIRSSFPQEILNSVEQKLDKLKERFLDLKNQYEGIPPEEIKEELFAMLEDVLNN